jgi:hypothetical protein
MRRRQSPRSSLRLDPSRDGMEGLDSIVEGTGGMELDGETAPRLIQRRPEPVIDEDGFEMVQSKKGGGKKK